MKDRRVGFSGRIINGARETTDLLLHRFDINVTPLFGGTTTHRIDWEFFHSGTKLQLVSTDTYVYVTYVCTYDSQTGADAQEV